MREGSPALIRREDYAAPAYWVRTVDLTFDLDPVKTIVHSRLEIVRNPERDTEGPAEPLRQRTCRSHAADLAGSGFRCAAGQLVCRHGV